MTEKKFKLNKLPSWMQGMDISYSAGEDIYRRGVFHVECACPFFDGGDDGYGAHCNCPHSPMHEKKFNELIKDLNEITTKDQPVFKQPPEYHELLRKINELNCQCPLLEEESSDGDP